MSKGPKVLVFDIETKPILARVWGLYDQNIGLNQIVEDWSVIAWAAKWLGDPPSKVMYQDLRKNKDYTKDKKLVKAIWKLLDEADIVVTQNGKKFDSRKLNDRFSVHGLQPPSSYKHIDTRQIGKKHFGFISHSLEYMAERLGLKNRKLTKRKFVGMDLWNECLNGNQEAWREMEKYNKADVLTTEELYKRLMPWDNSINFALYYDQPLQICSCGSKKFKRNGYAYTSVGKFQRYKCTKCGAEAKGSTNEFDKEKRKSLLRRVS